MELSEQGYEQVIRYVEGGMGAEERQAFEAALLQDSALAEEVEGYREVRAVGVDIEQKLSMLVQSIGEQKDREEEVWSMLQQAKQHWEQQQEGPSGAVVLRAVPGVAGAADKGKVKRLLMGRWLAAAVLAVVLCLGGVLWYQQWGAGEPKIAVKQRTPNTIIADHKQKGREQKGTVQQDTSASKPKAPEENTTAPSTNLDKQYKNEQRKAEMKQLARQSFVLDSLPIELPEVLAAASMHYQNQQHEAALSGYKEILNNIQVEDEESRGIRTINGDKELIRFYAHYYQAQSYMAINRTSEAIKELNVALKDAPTIYWKGKVEWYLALAYVQSGQIQRAEALLKRVQRDDPSGEYGEAAIELTRKLERRSISY